MSASRYAYIDEWKRLWEPDLEAIAYNGTTVDPTKVDAKVLQWAKENCAHKPYFVKVINQTSALGRPRRHGSANSRSFYLHVPTLFVQENFKELGRVVTLENYNGDGRTWRVSFGSSAPKQHPRWLQGWERVAKDNHLKPGDVMICVLVRKSCFQFTLFDEDGNMITNARSVTKENDLTGQHPKTRKRLFDQTKPVHAAGERAPGLRPNSTKKKKTLLMKEENSCKVRSHEMTKPSFESIDPFAFSIKSRRRVTTELENQRAWDVAMAHAKTLTGFHFISVMSETQVYRDFHLVLPDCFVEESGFPTEAAKWRILDCDGNAWDMYSMRNKRNNVTLHRKHWAQFSLHHFLEDGDVCVMELQEDDALAIAVHIFRVLPVLVRDRNSVYAHYKMREINAA